MIKKWTQEKKKSQESCRKKCRTCPLKGYRPPYWKYFFHYLKFAKCTQIIFECTESDCVCVCCNTLDWPNLTEENYSLVSKRALKKEKDKKGSRLTSESMLFSRSASLLLLTFTHIYILDHLKKHTSSTSTPHIAE